MKVPGSKIPARSKGFEVLGNQGKRGAEMQQRIVEAASEELRHNGIDGTGPLV
jgi:hypothetical protein